MKNSEASSLGTYYADHKAPAILSQNKERKIGRVFAEYKDKLIIVDGEVKKEHVYLIPKNKVDLYGDKKIYLNVSESSLKQFEFGI
jgi:hypothetical protein